MLAASYWALPIGVTRQILKGGKERMGECLSVLSCFSDSAVLVPASSDLPDLAHQALSPQNGPSPELLSSSNSTSSFVSPALEAGVIVWLPQHSLCTLSIF